MLLDEQAEELIREISPDDPDGMMYVYTNACHNVALTVTNYIEGMLSQKLPHLLEQIPQGYSWKTTGINKLFVYYSALPEQEYNYDQRSRISTLTPDLLHRLRRRRRTAL